MAARGDDARREPMNKWRWCVVGLSIIVQIATAAPMRPASMHPVYLRYITAPPMRAARSSWCAALRGKSMPIDRKTTTTTTNTQWAGMRLLTKQLDCRYMGALYAELRYAMQHGALRAGAWLACLRFAPVHQMKTAVELAVYVQCLQVIRGTPSCQTARIGAVSPSGARTGAACVQLLRTHDWSQWGEPELRGTAVSLFRGTEPPEAHARAHGRRLVHLPTRMTLRGKIRTGFSLNCCLFGMGFMMPYSYVHLTQAITVSNPLLGSVKLQDIELDRDVTGSQVDRPVSVACRRLAAGITGHYARNVYCWGTQLSPSTSSRN
jgi:hypothetical protein